MTFKTKWLRLLGTVICIFGILGGYHMFGYKTETLTREQQDNVVRRIVRTYDINSIEFTNFNKDSNTGRYHLLFVINGDTEYKTGLVVSEENRFNNSTDDISLSPTDIFVKFKRDSPLQYTQKEFEKVNIIYLEE